MGGILEGGVGISNKSSPHRAAIEKVQAELRKEFDVREERKRELEFLEKGGNPLDFKLGNAASVSLQSTSFTNLQPDRVTCEAKGSFAFTASVYGDSAESSGRLAAAPSEANTADNLMLFDAEHEHSEGDRNSFHPIRSNIVPPEQSSERDGKHGDIPAFGLPRKAYKRRNRSRPNRDGARSSSSDVNPALGCHGSFLPSQYGPSDVVGMLSDVENLDVSSNCNLKPRNPMDGTIYQSVSVDDHRAMELDDAKAVGSTEDLIKGVPRDIVLDPTFSKIPQPNQSSSVDAVKTSTKMDYNGPVAKQLMEEMDSAVVEYEPRAVSGKVEYQSSSSQMNGIINKMGDVMTNVAHNGSAARSRNGFDSESSYSQTNLGVDRNNNTETGTRTTINSNGDIDNQTLWTLETFENGVKETKEFKVINSFTVDEENASGYQSHRQNGPPLLLQEESIQDKSVLHDKLTNQLDVNSIEAEGCSGPESGRKPVVAFDESSLSQSEKIGMDMHHSFVDLPEDGSSSKVSTSLFKEQTPGPSLISASIDEESILKEAEVIEAKRKRIAELSMLTSPLEVLRNSQWDYVLEEMAWLANDFAQERFWKISASSQICKQAAFSSRLRKQEKSSGMKAKIVAHALAKSVMDSWHSVEQKSKEMEQPSQKYGANAVQSYMARFLKYNNSNVLAYEAETQLTVDKISDSGIVNLSWEDNLTEEKLFYTIPLGAMEAYRTAIEFHVAHSERIGSGGREEVETSACDFVADNSYYEDEGDAFTFGMSVPFDDSKSSKFGRKKRKHSTHAFGARACGIGSDLLPMQLIENKIATQQPTLLAKRPGSNINVSIPTKRMRTASRRILSPFNAGTSGCILLPNKTDASSGDTNSLQDDQSTLHGGSSFPINMEVESGGEFEKHLDFDSAEVSTKPKKKKKVKHPNSAFEQRWQMDSNFHNEQRDHSRKRSDSYQLESSDCNGLLGQPMMKKIMQPSQDGSFETISTLAGHVLSPVASQISNMYHPNKFYKMLGGRERGRKPKVLKMPTGQPGSGSPWSLFEDQALVVMVHDMGPNWELVSDAFNGAMQFKCIFRKAKECKERHNILMDRTSGDGAESAEDSGSSQPYPSTLPGIPKGSARQLFQHLKEPMEEETIRSHREKIILIGQKLRYHKTQDPKQLQQPHSSHTVALSQVCPNNMGGGPVLSPLDLCDANLSATDVPSLGYQGAYSSGLSSSNQSAGVPVLPTSGVSSALQGSSNIMLGNNFPSSPGPLSSSIRDGRFGVPRPVSLSIDEQQRSQHYNQMVSGRNGQQSNSSSPVAVPGIDHGIHAPPGGSGVGMMRISGSTQMARNGFQASTSSVNSGSMVSTSMHSVVRSGPGNRSLKPREFSPMMRPGPSPDSQRLMTPELQMQVSPGSNQVMSHFGGMGSPFPNRTASPPVSSYPLHHQQSHPISPQQTQVPSPRHPHFQGSSNHTSNPQQQAYAVRLAKERQLQQRFLQHQQPQQQQFVASGSSIPHAQPQPHLPASSAVQNSPQVQPPQTSTPTVSVSPLTSTSSINAMSQQQQKLPPTPGVIRNAQAGVSGLTNQTSKQRQKQQQPFTQSNRQHPQQRQVSQSQQQAKGVKGIGRGNMMIHQNIQIDPTMLNGVLSNLGKPPSDKGEPGTTLVDGQDSYSGSSVNVVPPTRQYASSQLSNQLLPQQKNPAVPASSSTKHLQQMIPHSDNAQGHVPSVAPAPGFPAAHQSVVPLAVASSNPPQVMPHQKSINQNQSAPKRVVQSSLQFNPETIHKAQPRGSDTYQNSTNNSSEMDATLPQHQWHTSEPLNDPNVSSSATSLGSLVSKPANISESMLQASQGFAQKPSPANLIPITQDVSSQRQRQQPQVQHPHSPAPSPHQQVQLLQAGTKFYGTPGESRME